MWRWRSSPTAAPESPPSNPHGRSSRSPDLPTGVAPDLPATAWHLPAAIPRSPPSVPGQSSPRCLGRVAPAWPLRAAPVAAPQHLRTAPTTRRRGCFPFRPGWLRRSPHVALLGEVVRASATVLFASASTISVALRTVWGAGWFAERRVRRSPAHCRGSLDRVDTRGEQRQIGVGVGWEVCGGGGGMGRVPREAPAFVVCLTAVCLPVVFRSPRCRARLNPGSGAPSRCTPNRTLHCDSPSRRLIVKQRPGQGGLSPRTVRSRPRRSCRWEPSPRSRG